MSNWTAGDVLGPTNLNARTHEAIASITSLPSLTSLPGLPVDASTLTGGTLASNVVTASITSFLSNASLSNVSVGVASFSGPITGTTGTFSGEVKSSTLTVTS